MRKEMKKNLSLLIVMVMLFSLFTACSNDTDTVNESDENDAVNSTESSGANDELTTIRIVMPGINDQETIDPISGIKTLGADSYVKIIEENVPGVNVEFVGIPWDNWIQKTEAIIEAGEADIAFYTNQVIAAEWFMDHGKFLEDDPDLNFDNVEDTFSKAALSYLDYSSFNYPEQTGKIFGLPLRMSNYYLLYDKKLFEDWGVEPPSMYASFDEIIEKAEQVTGINPVTGKQNYGAYITPFWMEWNMISFDAVKPYFSDTMLLSDLDTDEYVEYIKDSEEVLNYFESMARLINIAPPGIITNSGGEKMFTEDNDIGINFSDASNGYIKYLQNGDTSITDRYQPIFVPAGTYGQGFPEFSKVAVTKTSENPEMAWEVLKAMAIDKTVNGFYIDNYASNALPALKDYTDMNIMDYDFNKLRHEYHSDTLFVTDDYWFWRSPAQKVNNALVSKEVTPEEARIEFYELVSDWVADTKKQLGQE